MKMRTTFLLGSALAGSLLLAACGGDMDEGPQPATPPPPPPPPAGETEPYTQANPNGPAQGAPPQQPPPPPPPGASAAPPPAAPQAPLVQSYPTGQWVYMAGQGWVWVPAGAAAVEDEGSPYVYLYTPAYGWTWYVSPWGWGPYRYGPWVSHPWHPVGLHGYWVTHPHVTVHMGHMGHGGRR